MTDANIIHWNVRFIFKNATFFVTFFVFYGTSRRHTSAFILETLNQLVNQCPISIRGLLSEDGMDADEAAEAVQFPPTPIIFGRFNGL